MRFRRRGRRFGRRRRGFRSRRRGPIRLRIGHRM